MVRDEGEVNVAVRSGQTTAKRVDLGRLIVELAYADGKPMVWELVEVYTQRQDLGGNWVWGDWVTSQYTDDTGTVYFDLAPGQYAIRFRRPGENQDRSLFSITVQGGKITQLTI
jgi:hypothetical protein